MHHTANQEMASSRGLARLLLLLLAVVASSVRAASAAPCVTLGPAVEDSDSLTRLKELKSGDLSARVAGLRDQDILLTARDEKFLIELAKLLHEYLISVVSTHDAVVDHTTEIWNSYMLDFVKERVGKGEFAHPELRKAVSEKYFSKRPQALSPFLLPDTLRDVRRRGRHPVARMSERVVGMKITRSDLFYMLACFRIGTSDYAKVLDEEGAFDRKLALARFSDLTLKRGYLTLELLRRTGGTRTIETRGHIYLPRRHQAAFAKAHGPRRFDNSGKSLASKFFVRELKTPAKNFVTTDIRPAPRDVLEKKRQLLTTHIVRLKKLMGPEWAEADLGESTVSGEDTYFAQRVLMEEMDDYLKRAHAGRYLAAVNAIRTAASLEEAIRLAEELTEADGATGLAELLRAGPEITALPEANGDRRLSEAAAAIANNQRRSVFAAPLPPKIVKAAKLISDAEHLAVAGDVGTAVAKFEQAKSLASLSERRLSRLAQLRARLAKSQSQGSQD